MKKNIRDNNDNNNYKDDENIKYIQNNNTKGLYYIQPTVS